MDITTYQKEYEEALAAAQKLRKKWLSAALEEETKGYLEDIGGGCRDHKAYTEKVLPYWQRFGYEPEEFWFEFAGSRDGVMDPRFVPADLFYTEILPYLNDPVLAKAVDDKAYYDMWFPDAKQAVTVCRRISGVFYDAGMDMISPEEAAGLCAGRGCELFIKPSILTSAGRGIRTADASRMSRDEIAGILEKTGPDLIVQEKITQHPALAKLNPDSVCTIRISTLLMDGEARVVHQLLRVGAPGEKVLLRGKGNYLAQILEDGRLHGKALFFDPAADSEGKKVYTLRWAKAADEGLYGNDFTVPSMDAVRECAKKLHERLARFRYIGWDFTVDSEGDPVLIELNFAPGHAHGQACTGTPMLGDMTDRVLEDFFKDRTLR